MSSTDTTTAPNFEQRVDQKLDLLAANMQLMARLLGSRLTRAEVCERLGVHRNTLAAYINDKGFPKPGKDGKWLLEQVIEWEHGR